MESITTTQPRITTTILAGLFAVAAVAFVPAAAQASRIPADPVAFVPTPVLLSQLVTDSHASSVWTALQELRADVNGGSH
jgi:hypothetical protein